MPPLAPAVEAAVKMADHNGFVFKLASPQIDARLTWNSSLTSCRPAYCQHYQAGPRAAART